MPYAFLCILHNYEWNLSEDGEDLGCYFCNLENEEADKINDAMNRKEADENSM